MLIALTIAVLLGGGSLEWFTSDDFSAVESVIENAERVEVVTLIMQRANSRAIGLVRQREEHLDRITEIDAKVDASADAYVEVLNSLWQSRNAATDGYVRDVFELREHISREEWAAIFDRQDGPSN